MIFTLRRESDGDDQIQLLVSVSDTGVGIAQAKLNQVFSAFEQADTSTTREFGGTGLGLAITSRIVEAMGGKIWVESEVGAGSPNGDLDTDQDTLGVEQVERVMMTGDIAGFG